MGKKRRRKTGRFDGETRSMDLVIDADQAKMIDRYYADIQNLRASRWPMFPRTPRVLEGQDLRSARFPLIPPAANYKTGLLLHRVGNCPAMKRIYEGKRVLEKWNAEKKKWRPLWTVSNGSPVGMDRRVYKRLNPSVTLHRAIQPRSKIQFLSESINPHRHLRLNWAFIPHDSSALAVWRSIRIMRSTFIRWKDEHLMQYVRGGYARWEGAAETYNDVPGILLHLHVMIEPLSSRGSLPAKLKRSWRSKIPRRLNDPFYVGEHDTLEIALKYASGVEKGYAKLLRPYQRGESGLTESGQLWVLFSIWSMPRTYRQIGYFGEWNFSTKEGKRRKRSIERSLLRKSVRSI